MSKKEESNIIEKFKDGKYHSLKGPAYVDKENNITVWFKNGLKHRSDGPAVITPEGEAWYFEGKLHNLNGPAVDVKNKTDTHYRFFIHGEGFWNEQQFKEKARELKVGSLLEGTKE